jgi:hypothetical protein
VFRDALIEAGVLNASGTRTDLPLTAVLGDFVNPATLQYYETQEGGIYGWLNQQPGEIHLAITTNPEFQANLTATQRLELAQAYANDLFGDARFSSLGIHTTQAFQAFDMILDGLRPIPEDIQAVFDQRAAEYLQTHAQDPYLHAQLAETPALREFYVANMLQDGVLTHAEMQMLLDGSNLDPNLLRELAAQITLSDATQDTALDQAILSATSIEALGAVLVQAGGQATDVAGTTPDVALAGLDTVTSSTTRGRS